MSAMRALAWPEDDAEGPAAPTWTVPAQARAEAAPAQAARTEAARVQATPVPAALAQALRDQPPRRQATRGQAAQAAAVPLRLTRRGRVVVAAAAALLVALLSLLATGTAQATSHSAPSRTADRSLSQVVVRPGQSLWSIAENADPDADPRLVMQQIIELNSLTSDVIMAGQLLWVPRG